MATRKKISGRAGVLALGRKYVATARRPDDKTLKTITLWRVMAKGTRVG